MITDRHFHLTRRFVISSRGARNTERSGIVCLISDNEERRGVGDPRGVKARVWVWRVPWRPSPHQHMVRFMSIPWIHLVWPSFSASFCIYPLFVSASPLTPSGFSFTPSSCSTTTALHLSWALPGEQGSVPVDLDNETAGRKCTCWFKFRLIFLRRVGWKEGRSLRAAKSKWRANYYIVSLFLGYNKFLLPLLLSYRRDDRCLH